MALNLPSEPTLEVWLLSPKGLAQRAYVGVGQIPYITLGSYWDRGLYRGLYERLQYQTFLLTLEKDSLSYQAARDLFPQRRGSQHPTLGLGYADSHIGGSKYLRVKQAGSPDLLVPSVEIIRFYYGSSTRLARNLFDGAVHQPGLEGMVVDSSLHQRFCTIQTEREYNRFDARVIARLLYDDYALMQARRIRNVLRQKAANEPGGLGLFPEASFPFRGRTELKVLGLGFNDQKGRPCFLVHRIRACSGPFPFDEIKVLKPVSPTGTSDGTKPVQFIPGPREYPPPEEDGQIRNDKEPDKNTVVRIEAISPPTYTSITEQFQTIKTDDPRSVRRVKRKPNPEKPNDYSTSEGQRGNRGRQRLELVNSIIGELPRPMLFELVTAALVQLGADCEPVVVNNPFPERFGRLSLFPEEIKFPAEEEKIPWPWSFIVPSVPRRALVLSFKWRGKQIVAVEIERRPSEEFCLLLHTLSGDASTSVEEILEQGAIHKGVWRNAYGQRIGRTLPEASWVVVKHRGQDVATFADWLGQALGRDEMDERVGQTEVSAEVSQGVEQAARQ